MLVRGQSAGAEHRGLGWEMGRCEGEEKFPLLYQKSGNAKSSAISYVILTLGPGYPIGPSIPGSPFGEEGTES